MSDQIFLLSDQMVPWSDIMSFQGKKWFAALQLIMLYLCHTFNISGIISFTSFLGMMVNNIAWSSFLSSKNSERSLICSLFDLFLLLPLLVLSLSTSTDELDDLNFLLFSAFFLLLQKGEDEQKIANVNVFTQVQPLTGLFHLISAPYWELVFLSLSFLPLKKSVENILTPKEIQKKLANFSRTPLEMG